MNTRLILATILLGTMAVPLGAAQVPPPALDQPRAAKPATSTAVLAGGCFWGIEGVYEHVAGVTAVRSGYAGGKSATANYQLVGTGMTGHAEAVEIRYDPSKISYGELLRIFFTVAHDPTELNRQGPDTGTQYRSAIFPLNGEQAKVANAYIAQLNKAKVFGAPVVTTVETGDTFYPAEGYHQNYLKLNPDRPYIVINDLPKIAALKAQMPQYYRVTPVG